MAVITLTAIQAEAAFVLISQAISYLERAQRIREYNDEQCKTLIEIGKQKKDDLDKRREEH